MENQLKRLVWERIYDEVGGVEFFVDAGKCDLPDSVKVSGMVKIHIAKDMIPPISDLWVDDTGICATLSFSGESYPAQIPWESVFSIYTTNNSAKLSQVIFANVILGKPAT